MITALDRGDQLGQKNLGTAAPRWIEGLSEQEGAAKDLKARINHVLESEPPASGTREIGALLDWQCEDIEPADPSVYEMYLFDLRVERYLAVTASELGPRMKQPIAPRNWRLV